jgi:DNA-binding GntR family transcriptional regulator
MRRNTQFHFSIYSYADSPLLLEIINRLWARVFPYVFTYFFITQDNSKAMKRHWKMFQGLAERNKKKLTDALREDLEAAAAVIIPALEKSASHRTP